VHKVVGKVAEQPFRWLVVPVAVVALGVSGLFGGLRPEDQAAAADRVRVGQRITGQPWTATITGARLAKSSEDLPTNNKAAHWIVVRIELVVTGDEPVTVADTVRLRGVAGLAGERPAHTVLLRDHDDVPAVNPGLLETFDVYWEQAPEPAPPDTVLVDVYAETQRENSFTGQLIWTDPEVHATVTVPVTA
jgi:hypothetical protein